MAVVVVAVYAHWDGLPEPLRLGLLHARQGSGRELFEFEFDAAALAHPTMANLQLDPSGLRPSQSTCPPLTGSPTNGGVAEPPPEKHPSAPRRQRRLSCLPRRRALSGCGLTRLSLTYGFLSVRYSTTTGAAKRSNVLRNTFARNRV